MSDVHPDFPGSCGRCYEVKCDPSVFRDGYGNDLDRVSVCYDPDASIVLRTTDTCPCNYAGNYYSNKRWCCGDMDHFDISVWAFEKLADTKWGVIGLQYRPVPCNHVPQKTAPAPSSPFPGEDPPWGAKRPVRWQDFGIAQSVENFSAIVEQQSKQGTDVVYNDGLADGWTGAHWYANVDESADAGYNGGKSVCGTVYPGGAMAFRAAKGMFTNKISMELWIKVDQGVPDISVNLSGSGDAESRLHMQASCRPVKLQDMNQSGKSDGWARYDLYLGLFEGTRDDRVIAFAEEFRGCGGVKPDDLENVEIRNNKPDQQYYCADDIKLISG